MHFCIFILVCPITQIMSNFLSSKLSLRTYKIKNNNLEYLLHLKDFLRQTCLLLI